MKRITLVTLLVKDQEEALRFYRDKVGFSVAEDLPFGDKRWITLRAPEDGSLSIAVELAEGDAETALVGRQCGSKPLLALSTSDCMADYARMKKAGVRFRGEPEVRPYGTGVVMEDLYGNALYLNQEP